MRSDPEYILSEEGDYLLLLLRGNYDSRRLRQAIKEVGKCCRQKQYRRVLADAREHVGGIDLLDLHEFGEQISHDLPRGSVVAVVVCGSRLAMDRHLETVAVNRGVSFRLFTDFEEARLWLGRPVWKPVPAASMLSAPSGQS